MMQAQEVIEDIRRKGAVTSADGQTYPIGKHGIDAAEGHFLSEFIASRPDITRTLELAVPTGSRLCTSPVRLPDARPRITSLSTRFRALTGKASV